VNPSQSILTFARTIESPLGPIELRACNGALSGLYLPTTKHPPAPLAAGAWHPVGGEREVLAEAAEQLRAYFAGERQRFDLPLAAEGTAFQQRVWRMLIDIPFAATWSYGALARAVAHPTAYRAVGSANGRNPISIIIPCHRVIGSDGSLTGYGGGEPAKRWLIEHEIRVQGAIATGGGPVRERLEAAR
jgi:methylated-DNA-[protein]-cysteine S-methyltransferase